VEGDLPVFQVRNAVVADGYSEDVRR
jgi:hypothetical protein